MKSFLTTSLALATTALAANLPEVSVQGNAFFADGNRFYIRGVDYQPGGSSLIADPLADATGCARDIAEFKKLGINTVRVYTVDNSVNHDTCMNALADAGIYVILDVNSPKYSINRDAPGPSYNTAYLQNIFAVIDAFQSYSNTLAFFSGNEVINLTTASTATAPYIKAVTRDMKQYMGDRKYRAIPVGYSAADVATNRYDTALYMNCGTDDARSDFFAFNDYSWCDPSSYEISGWDQKVALFSNYSLPLFLSEYGCNKNTRTFQEVASLYGTNMTPVYSGGLVYEYSNEVSGFGLVDLNNGQVSELPDFGALETALKNTPLPTGDGGYRSNAGGANACPAQSSDWLPSSDSLPAIPADAVKYMSKGAGPGPGLNGPGSQNAGDASTGTATAGSGAPTVTGSSSSQSSGASSALKAPELSIAPFVCALVVAASSLIGTTLL